MPAIDEDDKPKKKVTRKSAQVLTSLSVESLRRARNCSPTRSVVSRLTWRKSVPARGRARSVFSQTMIWREHARAQRHEILSEIFLALSLCSLFR